MLQPLHIKLGLIKNLIQKFPKLRDSKLKEGIFSGLQFPEIINDDLSEHLLTETEECEWLMFKMVCLSFLGNVKGENRVELAEDLLNAQQTMGCNTPLKIHFLHSRLDFFPPNLGTVSDEHGERFHQAISTMDKRYAGKLSENMLAYYCWNLTEEMSIASYKRMSYKKKF